MKKAILFITLFSFHITGNSQIINNYINNKTETLNLVKKPITSSEKSLDVVYDSIYNYSWDSITNEYIINTRTYIQNNVSTFSYESQIFDGFEWQKLGRGLNTFDVNHNFINGLHEKWNGNSWENDRQITDCIYDSNNNLISQVFQEGNGSLFLNATKEIWTYENNSVVNYLVKLWNGTSWYDYASTTYTYDSNLNITSETRDEMIQNNWTPINQYLQTFNANNKIINKTVNTGWFGTSFLSSEFTDYYYNANNILDSSELTYNSNPNIETSKYSYSGNQITIDIYYNTIYIGQSITTKDINDNPLYYQSSFPTTNGMEMHNKVSYTYNNNIEESYLYMYYENGEGYGDSTRYYYSNLLTNDIPKIKENSLSASIYPNPTNNKTIISSEFPIEKLEIVDLNGNSLKLKNEQINSGGNKLELDLTELKQGIYIIIVETNSKIETLRITKL